MTFPWRASQHLGDAAAREKTTTLVRRDRLAYYMPRAGEEEILRRRAFYQLGFATGSTGWMRGKERKRRAGQWLEFPSQ